MAAIPKNDITCTEMLKEAGIRPTSNRILVLGTLLSVRRPMSLRDIEDEVPTLDKSSIFRCITLMHGKGLLHQIEGLPDGARYEVCHSHSQERDDDEHIHFVCEICGKTYCLEDIAIPQVNIPQEYIVHHSQYSIKGICPICSSRKRQ